jgi:NodT family efflux transporter outer membrane factor (OMF) lipoprotein
MIRDSVRVGAAVMAVALIAGCTVGPNYVRPSVEAPAAYKEAQVDGTGTVWKRAAPRDDIDRGKWWEIFGDRQLNVLAAQVEVSNQNVLQAEAQYRQAVALVRAARAAYFPTVTLDPSVTRSQQSRNGAVTGAGERATLYLVPLSVSWEIDLWGRVRRSVESSEASAQASAGDLANMRLSMQSELVADYFQLRANDVQRKLVDETVAAYAKSLELTPLQLSQGVVGQANVDQAETQLKSTQAQAIDLGIQRAQLEHAIAVLIGKPPAELSVPVAPELAPPPLIPLTLPSELLERRPDIAGAERRVAAANAQIGVAEAAYFPSLGLSASGGFESAVLSSLFHSSSAIWSIGAVLSQTVFDGGLRRSQTEQARASTDAAVASYRQTVLAAFQDVEDNLAALRILADEAETQGDAVRAARNSLALTMDRYKQGVASYLDVVTTQTILLSNEVTAITIAGRRMAAAVNLVKGLGGGWHAADVALPTSAD